jgi:hypothetical protein
MTDILNYAYVWYKENPDVDFTLDEEQKIYQIILNYSYPCYLGNSLISSMSPTDKTELLEHELSFIRKKFQEVGLVDVNIIQIPRVLYDLFNIYYYLKDFSYYQNDIFFGVYGFYGRKKNTLQVVKEKEELLKFNFHCVEQRNPNWNNFSSYDWYVNYTKDLSSSVLKNIMTLNTFIIDNIQSDLTNITLAYHKIFDHIITIINEKPTINLSETYKISDEKKIVLRQVLDFEIQPSIGETILYRGANFRLDTLWGKTDTMLHSLSLNNSMLSGFVHDITACTLNYVTPGHDIYKQYKFESDNKKIKYIIKKFHYNDLSDEFSLLFIPPIHPFMQLYCEGELWHPRTKFGIEIDSSDISRSGIICQTQNIDYLKSTKSHQDLLKLYEKLVSENRIRTWERKYLKYKNKYLELKQKKYNNLIGGGRIFINIYIDKQMVENEMILGTSTNINELLSNKKGKSQIQNIIENPQSYEYEYEINSTKNTIPTIKTDFLSKIKLDYQTHSSDIIVNIHIKKKTSITHHPGANFINKSNMDFFMQHLNRMDDDTLFVFIDGCAFMLKDAIEKNIMQQMPVHVLKYAFEHKLKIKFILLDMEFHNENVMMYNLAGLLNMEKINTMIFDDASKIHVYKFNIDKIQENELTKKYKKYIFDNILESEIRTLDIELYYVPIHIKSSMEILTISSTLKYDIIDFTIIKNKKIIFANFSWIHVVDFFFTAGTILNDTI